MQAAATDFTVALAAWVVFLAVFLLCGGTVVWSRAAMAIWPLSFALIFLFYKAVACIREVETPGMQSAGLRLLHFDGRPPSKGRRLLRLASSVLSALPVGTGLWWALADEEHLTIYDHMSSTFSTPARERR